MFMIFFHIFIYLFLDNITNYWSDLLWARDRSGRCYKYQWCNIYISNKHDLSKRVRSNTCMYIILS